MIREISIIFFYIILILFYCVKAAHCSTQGSIGITSIGSSTIEVVLGNATRISDVSDAVFSNWDGVGTETNNDDVCIYSNTAGGAYNITATGDGPGNSFQVSDGSGNYLDYNLRWNDVSGTNSGGIDLISGTILTDQTGADTLSTDCSGGSVLNSRIRIRFTEVRLLSAIANTYTGTVTFSISPE